MNNENSLAQNRAEELGYDLWEDFVIPPYYDSLDLLTAKKPRVVIGGRGCGKTSLLRYLCHQTQYSKKRSKILPAELDNIGIYWRIDTQFAKILSKRGLEDEMWNRAFEHLSVLMMTQEILKSLESVANSSLCEFDLGDITKFDFSILNSFVETAPPNFFDLQKFIRREINSFQTWAGSIRSVTQPIFLPLNFVKELISEIKTQNKLFSKTTYQVYVDEYENLLIDQQRLINTWLKHSEMPLIFNLAMKPHSFNDKNTIGNEPIAETHDYREYVLEDFSSKINFEVFAAEILFLRLWKNDKTFKIPINPDELRNTSKGSLKNRRSDDYRHRVLGAARDFLPGSSTEEISGEVFKDPILFKRLQELVTTALQNKNLKFPVELLTVSDYPLAGVIIPALINRGVNIDEILNEVNKLREGSPNKFTGSTNWIHNNNFGSLLLLFEPLGRFCPLYSGFEAFCLMSKTNLRHFLELCYKSLTNENLKNIKRKNISIRSQAEASKQASATFLREVKNFGNQGNRLHTFVLRLGTYFKYCHKRQNQSEPEQNHFSIKGDISVELDEFINEAVKWSVLYESRITKQKGGKNTIQAENFEYILNPIYAPYFHISYRKKRSVEFSSEDMNTFVFGDYEQFQGYLNSVAKKWRMESSEFPNLFTDIY